MNPIVGITGWDVADTAIKIGLGAAISAVTTFIITKRTHSHELRKERARRRQDTLEKISEQLEGIHAVIVGKNAAFHSYLTTLRDEQYRPIQTQSLDKLTAFIPQIGTCLHTLHNLEGRLLLLGLQKPSNLLREYRCAIVDYEELADPFKAREANAEEITSACEKLCGKRDGIYRELSAHYRSDAV